MQISFSPDSAFSEDHPRLILQDSILGDRRRIISFLYWEFLESKAEIDSPFEGTLGGGIGPKGRSPPASSSRIGNDAELLERVPGIFRRG